MNRLLLLLLLATAVTHLVAKKFYRSDYVYDEKTDAFYKVNDDDTYQDSVKERCLSDGAELFSVRSDEDKDQVATLLRKYPGIEYVWIQDDRGPSYYDDNGYSGSNSRLKLFDSYGKEIRTPSPYHSYPFICKVDAKKKNNEDCDTYDTGFEYSAIVGSCYKVSNNAMVWHSANEECQKLGSHLVVINSEAESEVLSNIMMNAPHLYGSINNDFFIAGFRAMEPSRKFKTVFSQTLEEAGFSRWNKGEPNNYENLEYCGALYKKGTLNDIRCSHPFAFICEKEISTLQKETSYEDIGDYNRTTLKAVPSIDSHSAASCCTNFFVVLYCCILSCFGVFLYL